MEHCADWLMKYNMLELERRLDNRGLFYCALTQILKNIARKAAADEDKLRTDATWERNRAEDLLSTWQNQTTELLNALCTKSMDWFNEWLELDEELDKLRDPTSKVDLEKFTNGEEQYSDDASLVRVLRKSLADIRGIGQWLRVYHSNCPKSVIYQDVESAAHEASQNVRKLIVTAAEVANVWEASHDIAKAQDTMP